MNGSWLMQDDVLDLPGHVRSRVPLPEGNDTRAPERDDERGLPSLVAGEYRPFGRPSNKPLYSLHFISPTGDVRSFQYCHLDSDSRYTQGTITIRFVGASSLGLPPIQIVCEGRNFWRLYDYLYQHRIT